MVTGMSRLNIPRQLFGGFVVLRNLGSDRVQAFAKAIPPTLLRMEDFELVLKNLGIEEVALVSSVLFNLSTVAIRRPVDRVLDDVARALRDGARWSTEELETWKLIEPALAALLTTDGLVTLCKTIQLQYEHANILTETHVITDMRPVFNREATKPVAVVTCHTLRISYHSRGAQEHRHIALALDTADLKQLISEAERALRKAEVMAEYLQKPAPLPNRVAGDEDA